MPANPLGVALRNRRADHHTLVWARPDLQAPENFTLTSPAFDHRASIPEKHRGRLFGANISPALDWTRPPADAVELVLIVQDPDVPFRKPATHALTLGIDPSLNGIPENALANPSPNPGIRPCPGRPQGAPGVSGAERGYRRLLRAYPARTAPRAGLQRPPGPPQPPPAAHRSPARPVSR
jgi:phosphatidylethanolamine-binding protein (PEBP) family uncharacterized protein